nr:peptidoglycan DD-metalloendopeptidase family protein [Rikenella sp.]
DLERKAVELQELGRQLNGEVAALDGRKRELAGLQEEHTAEARQLEEERVQLRKTQDELRGREKELLAQAEKRRKQVAELERQLQQAVNDEVRRAKNSSGKGGGGQTVAQGQLTAQFEARKGQLLRPVEGVVVDRFGVHNHPTQQGVKVNNKGVNIAARAGSEVQAIFGGEVRKVFFFQGLGMSVLVRHGAYLTIYANLESVFVREGEQVMEGTPLGTVARAASGQQATLHFEVWKESATLNPEQWIRR